MGIYENFETIKDTLGYVNLSTEEIIAKGHLSETSISQIDKKMEEGIRFSYMDIIYSAIVRIIKERPQLNRLNKRRKQI